MTAGSLDGLSVLVLAAVVGTAGFLVIRRAPRLGLAVWLFVLCAVPVWAGIQVVFSFEPVVATGLVVLAALFPLRRHLPVRPAVADLVVAAFVLSAVVPFLLGSGRQTSVFVLLAHWAAAYLLGRLVVHRVPLSFVYGAIAVAFSVVAALALVEWASGWNPFVQIPGSGSLHTIWSTIQERGGVARAEGAFGHSIALGGSLAMALPMVLAAPLRASLRVGMVVLIGAGCAVTFSRIGLGTAALGILLSLVFLRTGLSARLRVGLFAALVAAAAVVLPVVAGVFDEAGDEATGSAEYRGALLSLVGEMRLLGLSESFDRNPVGGVSFGSFESIDSALILLGLTYGWIPLVLLLAGALLAVVTVLRGRATAPTIALVAQLPALATVALITQYSSWVWFVAGLAVASQLRRAEGESSRAEAAPAHADGALHQLR